MIRILAVLGAPLLGTGCFWVAVGGAGAETGYVASQEDRSAGQTMSDQWIFTKAKAALVGASGVPSGRITVKVRKGVVKLIGVVDSAEQKAKALAAVRGVEGVKGVDDRIRVD